MFWVAISKGVGSVTLALAGGEEVGSQGKANTGREGGCRRSSGSVGRRAASGTIACSQGGGGMSLEKDANGDAQG